VVVEAEEDAGSGACTSDGEVSEGGTPSLTPPCDSSLPVPTVPSERPSAKSTELDTHATEALGPSDTVAYLRSFSYRAHDPSSWMTPAGCGPGPILSLEFSNNMAGMPENTAAAELICRLANNRGASMQWKVQLQLAQLRDSLFKPCQLEELRSTLPLQALEPLVDPQAWCSAFMNCVNDGRCPPWLLAAALQILDAPTKPRRDVVATPAHAPALPPPPPPPPPPPRPPPLPPAPPPAPQPTPVRNRGIDGCKQMQAAKRPCTAEAETNRRGSIAATLPSQQCLPQSGGSSAGDLGETVPGEDRPSGILMDRCLTLAAELWRQRLSEAKPTLSPKLEQLLTALQCNASSS